MTYCKENYFYTADRNVWRKWLSENFEKANDIWLVFPMKESGEQSLLYNDAVEEALCFGWIDSTIKHIDEFHRAQHFTPRNKNSSYSRPNIERLIWLESQKMLHPKIRQNVLDIISEPYVFPIDIICEIKQNETAWANYQKLPLPYRRIRIAYIDAARNRPEEFTKRLVNFICKTEKNKMIRGFGGIEKYYGSL